MFCLSLFLLMENGCIQMETHNTDSAFAGTAQGKVKVQNKRTNDSVVISSDYEGNPLVVFAGDSISFTLLENEVYKDYDVSARLVLLGDTIQMYDCSYSCIVPGDTYSMIPWKVDFTYSKYEKKGSSLTGTSISFSAYSGSISHYLSVKIK